MNKGKFLCDLTPGSSFQDCVFAVARAEQLQDRHGRSYIALTFSDRTDRRSGKWFQTTPEQWADLSEARFVRVSGTVQGEGPYSGDIQVTSARAVPVPADLDAFLAPLQANAVEQQERFLSLISTIENGDLRRLLDTIFDPDSKLWSQFCEAVAARSMHHAYRGGLLDHTLEVAELCSRSCSVLVSLRRDFVVTCALLHDIGKLEEMDHGIAAGEYTSAGNLVGHIVLGAWTINKAAEAIPGFPEPLKHAVTHLILSHHGTPEFGAARFPACAEAHVLASCDLMSARVEQCRVARESAPAGQHSIRNRGGNGKESHFIFVGDIAPDRAPGEQDVEPSVIALDDAPDLDVTSGPERSAPAANAMPRLFTVEEDMPKRKTRI